MTSYQPSATGLYLPPSRNGHASLSEVEVRYQAILSIAEATVADLRAQLNDPSWQRLTEGGGEEFGREDVLKIAQEARAFYLKNPIVRKGVDATAYYIHGQDLSINAEDEKVRAVLDRFWDDNRATLTSQQATRLQEIEFQCTGNTFTALFPNRITGQVLVRSVPLEEITDIITSPQDRAEVRYYRRRWTERAEDGLGTTEREAFHPDWNYLPTNRLTELNDKPILWDIPIAHQKCGAFPHWKWGVSPVYPALAWANAYKQGLEYHHSRNASLSRFAYNVTTTGGAAGVAAGQARLASTFGVGNGRETNPAPPAGAAYVHDKNLPPLEPIRLAGTQLDPDDNRPLRLMASAALGIPDHFFDADVGNYATASTLDRPTELRFSEMRQDRKDFYEDLAKWVINADLRASRGLLPKTINEKARRVTFSWPSLLERDKEKEMGALVSFYTLNGSAPANTMPSELVARKGMEILEVEDVDQAIQDLADEQAERDAKAAQIARQQPTGPTGVTGPTQPSPTGATGGTGATGTAESLHEANPKVVVIDDDAKAAAAALWDELMPDHEDMLSPETS